MTFDQLAWPWALAALALLPVLIWRWSTRPGGALVFSASGRARRTGRTLRAGVAWLPGLLRVLALGLLIVALARPQAISGDTETTTEAVALQLVVDRSGSMGEPTVLDGREVRRLDAVKEIVREFVAGDGSGLAGRRGDLLGLIVFGTYADTLTPMSREHAHLLDRLAEVDLPQLRQEQATAIGDAVALAAARLKSTEEQIQARAGGDELFELKSKAIVLLTDGENTEGRLTPIQSAQLAAEWGVRIYVVGIRGGVVSQQLFGPIRTQAINERELGQVAEVTGGRFWAVETMGQLREVYQEIDELEKTTIEVSEQTVYEERFQAPAAAGLALLGLELLLGVTLLRRLP